MKYTKTHKHLRYLYFVLGLCGILVATLANSPAPAQAALTSPPTPDYFGALERADCSQISGFAYDDNAPDVTVSVDIYDNGNYLTTVPANRFRRDLFDAGWPNPNHGFLLFTPGSLKDGRIHTISANFAGTGVALSGSPKFLACNASVFYPTTVPQTTANGQGQTWEQGVEISSSMSGIISKICFWRSAGEPVGVGYTHKGRIWSNSGALLASATFSDNTGPGWQCTTVNFPITASTHYRVTYNVYVEVGKTFFAFNNGPITKGPLTAWTSWFGTPAGTFPTSNSTSNLFADVVFNGPQ